MEQRSPGPAWGLPCRPSSAGTCCVAFGECPQCSGPLACPALLGDGDGGTLEHSDAGKLGPCPHSASPVPLALGWVGLVSLAACPPPHPGSALPTPSSPPSALGTRQAGCGPAPPCRVLVSVRKSLSPETRPASWVRCGPRTHWRDRMSQGQVWHSALSSGQSRAGTSARSPGLGQG